MESFNVVCSNEEETRQFGRDVALAILRGDMIALKGGLGAGKTALSRAIIRYLAKDEMLEVPSPTYTLCQSYRTEPQVSHFDFYRLDQSDEVLEQSTDKVSPKTSLNNDDSSSKTPNPETETKQQNDDEEDLLAGFNSNNTGWRCVCEEGSFLPPALLKTFGPAEAMVRLGTGQCYHKQM